MIVVALVQRKSHADRAQERKRFRMVYRGYVGCDCGSWFAESVCMFLRERWEIWLLIERARDSLYEMLHENGRAVVKKRSRQVSL